MREIFKCSENKIINGRVRLTFVKLQEESTSERSMIFTFLDGKTSKFIWFKKVQPFEDYRAGDKFEIDLKNLKSFHYLSNVEERIITKKDEVAEEMEVDMNESMIAGREFLQESSSFQEDLMKSVKESDVDKVKEILRCYPNTVNVPDKNKNYALHYAVADGNEKLTNALLEVEGINVNARNVRNLTALHIAVANAGEENYKKIVESLLGKENISLEVKDSYGNTPLHYAAEKGNWELLKKLLKKSQEKNENIDISKVKNTFGWTLLHSAASGVFENEENKCWNVIEELLKDKNFKFSEEQISSVEDLLEEDKKRLEKYREILSIFKYKDIVEERSEEEKEEREFKILMISTKKE